jgi:hypothetical protein
MAQLYWEAQESGFCGVHCTNNLLQGAYFTEVDFSEIALKMDAAEKKLMMEEGTETREFLQYMAQDSENVNSAGNFSIQVLEKAISIMGLKIAPLMVTSTTDPTTQDAIVCNLASHWFSLRKVDGTWFNLNSLFKGGPQLISTFYLSAYLQQLQTEKYSIFVVSGKFPQSASALGGRGKWFPTATIINRRTSVTRPSEGKQTRFNDAVNRMVNYVSGPPVDRDLERALDQSRRDNRAQSRTQSRLNSPRVAEDADLARVLALSRREK